MMHCVVQKLELSRVLQSFHQLVRHSTPGNFIVLEESTVDQLELDLKHSEQGSVVFLMNYFTEVPIHRFRHSRAAILGCLAMRL